MGAQVTIVSRNPGKMCGVAETIKTETGNPVEFIAADLSTLAGIMQAAATFQAAPYPPARAGQQCRGMFTRRQVDLRRLRNDLRPQPPELFPADQPVIGCLESQRPGADCQCLLGCPRSALRSILTICRGKNTLRGMQAYGQSKLANVLFTYELARRLEGSGVTANALHPGFIATGFARNNGAFLQFRDESHWSFHPKADQGAQTSIYLASSPEGGRCQREILRRLQSRRFQPTQPRPGPGRKTLAGQPGIDRKSGIRANL